MTATTLEWFGTTTFRIRTSGLTLFFDAYLDRVPGLPPVGLSTAEVTDADFVFVSHAHFDHLYGADAIARQTGATVVASPESAKGLRVGGVPEEQLLVVTGGETVDCGYGVRVRGLPALHSCLWAHADLDTGAACLGDLDVSAQDRSTKTAALFDMMGGLPDPVGPSLTAMLRTTSAHDGGQLAYLLRTDAGSVLVSGSAGHWSGIYAGLGPDVALLAAAGRPNLDGEPFQGSTAQYLADQVGLLGARRVAFCHHDALIPGLPGVDLGPAAAALREHVPDAGYFALEYSTPITLFD